MNVIVVGAGWYGCHIARTCIAAGYRVIIVDKANGFFKGSSSKNQNRLHLGYHYPRSEKTIKECQRGFSQFEAEYGNICTSAIPNNLYLISSCRKSKTSTAEFSHTFDIEPLATRDAESTLLEALPFSEVRGYDGVFRVGEKYIDNTAAALYFATMLGPHFLEIADPSVFETEDSIRHHVAGIVATMTTVATDPASFLINCTYNHLDPIEFDHYELYLSLLYHIPGPTFALTVMDGNFFSIYPHTPAEKIYTLTSVQYGVALSGLNQRDADGLDVGDVATVIRELVEGEVGEMIPDFKTVATYTGYMTSWKTKPATTSDDRSLRWHVDPEKRVVRLYGGKITGIFDAAEIVLSVLNDAMLKRSNS
jgi:hypothetical protein